MWAENLRESLLSAFHPASGSCPQSLCSLLSHRFLPVCLSVCIQISLLIRTPLIGLWPTTFHYDLILTWLCLQRCYFQIRSHSQVLGVRIWTYIFGEGGRHSSSHNKPSIVFFSSYCVSQIQAMVLYFSSSHCQLLWKIPHSVLTTQYNWHICIYLFAGTVNYWLSFLILPNLGGISHL